MFSLVQNLTSILRSQEARAVDSHLPRKRGGGEDAPNSRDDDRFGGEPSDHVDTDGAALSVESLIWFLEDYLEERMSKGAKAQDSYIDDGFKPWVRQDVSNNNDSMPSPRKVAGIYDKNAKTFSATRSSRRAGDVEAHGDLAKDIYFLIHDLRVLKEHGVYKLVPENDCSFLEGVFRAVDKKKRGL